MFHFFLVVLVLIIDNLFLNFLKGFPIFIIYDIYKAKKKNNFWRTYFFQHKLYKGII